MTTESGIKTQMITVTHLLAFFCLILNPNFYIRTNYNFSFLDHNRAPSIQRNYHDPTPTPALLTRMQATLSDLRLTSVMFDHDIKNITKEEADQKV